MKTFTQISLIISLFLYLTISLFIAGCGEDTITNSGSNGNPTPQDSLLFEMDSVYINLPPGAMTNAIMERFSWIDSAHKKIKLAFTGEVNFDTNISFHPIMQCGIDDPPQGIFSFITKNEIDGNHIFIFEPIYIQNDATLRFLVGFSPPQFPPIAIPIHICAKNIRIYKVI